MPNILLCSLVILLLASFGSAQAQNPAQSFELQVKEARPFGYTLGDIIHRVLVLDLSNDYELVPDSLPSPGRLDLWLELDPPLITQIDSGDIKRYRIALNYRLINLTEPEQMLTIAEHVFKIKNGPMSWNITVPPFILAAHQVAPDPADSRLPALRPLAPPPPLVLQQEWGWLTAAALLGVVSLTGLAWIYGVLPWLKRAHGPFARAYRDIRRHSSTTETALLSLHRAFNTTAGETVFGHCLNDFFATHPQFTPLRQPIERFFAYSQRQFFDTSSSAPKLDIQELARQLRLAERQRA